MNIYPGYSEFGTNKKLYVKTDEFRPPKAGEFFLSGAKPEVYRALYSLGTSYHIMREVTNGEKR